MKIQPWVLLTILSLAGCGSETKTDQSKSLNLTPIDTSPNVQDAPITTQGVIPDEEPVAPVQVKTGEFVANKISISDKNNFTENITHKGASYLKLHFAEMNLQDGDYIQISDGEGQQVQSYSEEHIQLEEDSGWWAITVLGDSVDISIVNDHAPVSKSSFAIIDKYTQGFSEADDNLLKARSVTHEKTCGSIDYRDAICYEDSHPVEYARTRPTARLLLNHGRSTCTGWRVGPNEDTMMTNEHCIASQAELDAAEIWFNYQRTGCASGTSRSHMTIVKGNKLLSVDSGLDYALFTVKNAAAIQQFGYYELDPRTPQKNERIYIPQHPNSKPKQLAIFSDRNSGGFCAVDTPLRRNVELGYMCDTAGGSSGSAVLSATTDKVIGLHHTGGCTNNAVRIDKIWPYIADFLQPVDPTIPPKDNNGDIINLAEQGFTRYSSRNANSASHEILNNNQEIKLNENLWLRSAQLYTISPDTILEFEYSSNEQGEIHGIGFDEDDTASADRIFKLAGNQDWGISGFLNANNKRYTIPVGQFYTGEMRLILTNDNDEGVGNVSVFRNIRVCEFECPLSEGAISFKQSDLTRFSSSTDPNASFRIDNSRSITLEDNIWLRTDQQFDINTSTVLSFEFSGDGRGEIQGIGFDEDSTASSNRIFKLAGTQDWGISEFNNDGQTRRYEIPVGQFYTGRFHLILVNDNDAGSGNVVTISNVQLCNGPCESTSQPSSPASPAQSSPAPQPTDSTIDGVRTISSSAIEFHVTADVWADVHYRINGGEQQNFRMNNNGSEHTFTINQLSNGDVVEFQFTTWSNACNCANDSNWREFTF